MGANISPRLTRRPPSPGRCHRWRGSPSPASRPGQSSAWSTRTATCGTVGWRRRPCVRREAPRCAYRARRDPVQRPLAARRAGDVGGVGWRRHLADRRPRPMAQHQCAAGLRPFGDVAGRRQPVARDWSSGPTGAVQPLAIASSWLAIPCTCCATWSVGAGLRNSCRVPMAAHHSRKSRVVST